MRHLIKLCILKLRDRLKIEVSRRVVWLTRERYDQTGGVSSRPALICVIGREYYEERRRDYPILGYRELAGVLRLEAADERRSISYIGPVKADHREVIFFDFNERFDPDAPKAWVWIPETFLVSRALSGGDFATVERHGMTYFVADSGVSFVLGGAVRAAHLFAFAVGLQSDRSSLRWSAEDLRAAFMLGLRRVSSVGWLRFVSPDIGAWTRRNWRFAAFAAAATLVVYLMGASAYLFGVTLLRERELRGLGPEVSALLEKQRAVEHMAASQAAVVRLLSDQRPTYRIWGVAADGIKAGASISGLFVQNGDFIIRGRGKVATDVLTKISSRPDVRSARFSSPVRPEGDDQNFTIALTLASSQATSSSDMSVVLRGP